MSDFWDYPFGVLVEVEGSTQDLLDTIDYWGKSGWKHEVWDGAILHVRFNDQHEAVYFAYMNNGAAYG